MEIVKRVEVNNRANNHWYTLVYKDDNGVVMERIMTYQCDRCSKAALYRNGDDLLCIDHHLDALWRR